jgi:hypothetical protein
MTSINLCIIPLKSRELHRITLFKHYKKALFSLYDGFAMPGILPLGD